MEKYLLLIICLLIPISVFIIIRHISLYFSSIKEEIKELHKKCTDIEEIILSEDMGRLKVYERQIKKSNEVLRNIPLSREILRLKALIHDLDSIINEKMFEQKERVGFMRNAFENVDSL